MKNVWKKSILLVMLCLLLGGCAQATQVAEETVEADSYSTEVVATQVVTTQEGELTEENETVEETTEVESMEETIAIEETVEEATDEETAETVEETTGEETAKTQVVDSDETKEVKTSNEDKKEIVVTALEEPKTLYATIALNVRRGPSTDYEKAGSLAMAESVMALGQADTGWYFFMMDGQAVYASDKYLSETKPELPPPAPAQPAQQASAVQQTPAQAAVAPAGVIMVGDSRCVQMQEAVGGGGCSWICENSKEYTWFVEKAIPRFDQYVGNGTKVVINLGVNDPEHYKQYVETINAKAAEWAGRGARTYLVSVNPVWENPYTTQEQVDTFNANVPGMLSGVTWIDTSSWLNANGYRLLDGLHYDAPTYVNIFNLIMGSL